MITENVFSLKWTGVTISAMFGSGDKTYQFFFRYLFMWSLIFWKMKPLLRCVPRSEITMDHRRKLQMNENEPTNGMEKQT